MRDKIIFEKIVEFGARFKFNIDNVKLKIRDLNSFAIEYPLSPA